MRNDDEGKSEERKERNARWIELGITIVVSAMSSSVIAAWIISSTLATMQANISENKRRIDENSYAIQNQATLDAVQQERIATTQARFEDILRRLDRIETKLDSRK